MSPRRGVIFLVILVFVGLSAGSPLMNARAAKQPPHDAWVKAMEKLRVPARGCFRSAFPSVKWIKAACVTPKRVPFPARPPRPFTVGNGTDFSGQITPGFGGLENAAEGSFDSSTATSESGGGVANKYSLQLSTNTFTTSLCTGHPGCQGWEQFIYSSKTIGGVLIQFWLLNFGASCPAGWNSSSGSCFMNSLGTTIAAQPITNLTNLRLVGDTTSGNDTVRLFAGGTTPIAVASSTGSPLGLAAGWTGVEFAIVGDCCFAQANFSPNPGSTLTVRTTIHYGTTHAPTCASGGFTGETNNLTLVGTPNQTTGAAPAIVSVQSNAPGTTGSCKAADGIGDTHLTTFNGLLYDFQAAGDFTLAQRGPQFVVQTRQVSGAPTWPNASVNSAVGTRMGSTRVAVCLPNRVQVNGRPTTVSQSTPLRLPGGVDISRTGNVYLIRGPEGDSVRAQVNNGWIDVKVGLGGWPSTVRGLLANANDNVSQLATSGGTVLTVPMSFKELYFRYGNSWRVKGASLLCGKRVVSSNPTQPFYVKNLPPDVAKRARATCLNAGVRRGPLLDACTLDVAVTGNPDAAKAYVGAPAPVAVAIPR
jgi:hypothetical protein